MSRRDPRYPFTLHNPDTVGRDGYPRQWHRLALNELSLLPDWGALRLSPLGGDVGVKDVVRARAEHRCVRCGHPYIDGGEWSPCDERCTHDGPVGVLHVAGGPVDDRPTADALAAARLVQGAVVARWRILTVHHLNGVKWDLRWWNLVSLCQRCHLQIQGKVVMERVWPWPHTDWFKVYAAGWYAWAYEGLDLTRAETEADLERLLSLERIA